MIKFLLAFVCATLIQSFSFSQTNTTRWSTVQRTKKGAVTDILIGETATHLFTLSKNEGLSEVVIYAHNKATMAISGVYSHKKSDLRGEQFLKAFVMNDRIYLFTQQLTAMTRDLYVETFTTSLARLSEKKRLKRLEYASPKSPEYLSEFVLLQNSAINDHFILCNTRKSAKDKVELVYSLYDLDCNQGESGSFETHLDYKTSGLGGSEFELLADGTIVTKTKVLWTFKDEYSSSRSMGNMITLYNIYSEDRIEYSFNDKGMDYYNAVVAFKDQTLVITGFYSTPGLSGDDPIGVYRVWMNADGLQEEEIEHLSLAHTSSYLQKVEKGVSSGLMAETAFFDDQNNLILLGSEFRIKESGGSIEWSRKKDMLLVQLSGKSEIDWVSTIPKSESSYQHKQQDAAILKKNGQFHILYEDKSQSSQLNSMYQKMIVEESLRHVVLSSTGEVLQSKVNTASPGWDDLKNTTFIPYALNGEFCLLKSSSKIRFALPMALFVIGGGGGFLFAPLYVLTIPAFILGFNSNYVEYNHCQAGTFSPK